MLVGGNMGCGLLLGGAAGVYRWGYGILAADSVPAKYGQFPVPCRHSHLLPF